MKQAAPRHILGEHSRTWVPRQVCVTFAMPVESHLTFLKSGVKAAHLHARVLEEPGGGGGREVSVKLQLCLCIEPISLFPN